MAALPLIVFDVNETLLDLETMEPTFQRIFDDKSAPKMTTTPCVRLTLRAGSRIWPKPPDVVPGLGLERLAGKRL
jgi:hypothetical protein